MDRIDELIERAIAVVEMVMLKEPDRVDVAREFLRRLAEELRSSAPDHPALTKLERYLSDAGD